MRIHPAGRSAALMSAALAIGACAALTRGGPSQETSASLVVENRTGSEVVVYALPSSRAVGIRLGNIQSFTTTTIAVPRSALQGAVEMVGRLHAIGGARDWISPRISLNEDLTARLDIRADARGDMSQSAFYTLPPPSGGAAGDRAAEKR